MNQKSRDKSMLKVYLLQFMTVLITMFLISSQVVYSDWPMLGANPQRTSWTSDEVRGGAGPEWYRPIESYVHPKIQVICANDRLYISSAKGLYCLDAATGDEVWVYPTQIPLGHSPTVVGNVIYVGGHDRRIHAIDNTTGQKLSTWNFYSGTDAPMGGFEVNPLVVGGTVYAGNKDGYFYAFDATTGDLKWKYKTDAPIVFSAAYDSSDGAIYFASNDMCAYSLTDGGTQANLKWKSQKLPGAGFHSFWPVIYNNYVIYGAATNYRQGTPGIAKWSKPVSQDVNDLGTGWIGPTQNEPGLWASGTETIDMQKAIDYFEDKPYRRTCIILNKSNGQEYTFDSDEDGKQEYVPILWAGTHSGNRFPVIVGGDGAIYSANHFQIGDLGGAQISAWKWGSKYCSQIFGPSGGSNAVDEPYGYAAGGNLIYWTICCGREGGAFDITDPSRNTYWNYYVYSLHNICPNLYLARSWGSDYNGWGTFGRNSNGIFMLHENVQNPPIPYASMGRIYTHKFNCVICFRPGAGSCAVKSMSATQSVQNAAPALTTEQLMQKLEEEVQKMINAGHLRPAYWSSGNSDGIYYDYRGLDYFGKPGETFWALSRAYPYLSAGLKSQVATYLQNELTNFAPYNVALVGWNNGASREWAMLPDDIDAQASSIGNKTWDFPIELFYGLWKYAEAGLGNASSLFSAAQGRLGSPDTSTPQAHNSSIAGYKGYVELGKLASQNVSSQESTLNSLLSSRASNFNKDTPYTRQEWYSSGVESAPAENRENISRNFHNLTPELAEYLRNNAFSEMQTAIAEYEFLQPYWFVGKLDATWAESTFHHLWDRPAIFNAKTWIMQASRQELCNYLDGPACIGDLYYIHNLVSAIEAVSAGPATKISLSASATALPADGTSTSTLEASVRDANDMLVIDTPVSVTFSKTSGSGSINPPTTVTTQNGIATATYVAGTTAGTVTLTATASGLSQGTVNITLVVNNPPTEPTDLLCNGLSNPTNVGDLTPDLSWTFNDPNSGDTQIAYQILVANSQSAIDSNNGNMWDAGKVISTNKTVTYNSTNNLQPSTQYWWKVKTWDNFDAEGVYSAVATFTTSDIDPRCYNGLPFSIPGKIELEEYDNGGEGVAYHDTTTANEGGGFRTSEGVDIGGCSDTGGGYDVGWTRADEWLEYTVDVAQAGDYTIEVRMAHEEGGADFHIEFGPAGSTVDKTGTITAVATGGWETWQTMSVTGIALSAGKQIMRLCFDTGAGGYNAGPDVNYINITEEFVITPEITVTSPNGQETWTVGDTKTITWTSQGSVGNVVDIDLSTNGGTNWTTFVSGTGNDGSESITVPNSPSTTCRIRVEDVSGTPSDTSNSNFTIEESPDPPYISVSKTTLDFEEVEIGNTSTLDFQITNTGGSTLSGSISTDKKWIEVQPTSFVVDPVGEGNTVLVNVKVDNSILNQPEGKYTGKVSITSNGGNIDVEVTLVATCVLVKPNPYNPAKGPLTFFGDGIVLGETTIRIYTLGGELIKTLGPGNVERSEILLWRGTNENGETVTSGIYIYVYESPNEQGVGKFTVIRQ